MWYKSIDAQLRVKLQLLAINQTGLAVLWRSRIDTLLETCSLNQIFR